MCIWGKMHVHRWRCTTQDNWDWGQRRMSISEDQCGFGQGFHSLAEAPVLYCVTEAAVARTLY
jgi:hypothetical protein